MFEVVRSENQKRKTRPNPFLFRSQRGENYSEGNSKKDERDVTAKARQRIYYDKQIMMHINQS